MLAQTNQCAHFSKAGFIGFQVYPSYLTIEKEKHVIPFVIPCRFYLVVNNLDIAVLH